MVYRVDIACFWADDLYLDINATDADGEQDQTLVSSSKDVCIYTVGETMHPGILVANSC
jgi:hypothetical protein